MSTAAETLLVGVLILVFNKAITAIYYWLFGRLLERVLRAAPDPERAGRTLIRSLVVVVAIFFIIFSTVQLLEK